MLDAPTEMIPAALNYLGLDPDSKDPAEIEKAGDLLKTIRPSIQKYHSSEYINALANGDICVAVGWSGDVLQARDRAAEADNGVTVEYAIPKEGAQMWFDQMAIPADAPNMDHTSKAGDPKLLKECSLPLTGVKCVDRIITNFGVFDVVDGGLKVVELAPDVTLEEVKEKTQATIV